jgi:glycerol-3-phosphate dehydrogenase
MNRDPRSLTTTEFDVLVVGAGITGACLACDAARRGLSVALIDKGDFGAATSAASSKLLHGGLRYLQQLRFGKARESAFERMYFQNLAPHLARWVPFVVPTYRGLAKSRFVLGTGMLLYEAACRGQQQVLRDPTRRLPASRSLGRDEVADLVPGISAPGLTGGRMFYESHMISSERMTLAFVQDATHRGAAAANYVEAQELLLHGGRVSGVRAVDALDGGDLEIRARLTINAAGPWIGELNDQLGGRNVKGVVTGFSRGAHIVTRALTAEVAVALPTRRRAEAVIDRGGRHVFIIPWRGHSLIGTTYGPFEGRPDEVTPLAQDADELVADINAALGPQTLSPSDVRYSYAGLYPLTAEEIDPDVYQGSADYQVVDHAETDATPGLMTVFGAKYTTARLLAERAVDRVVAILGRGGACTTRQEALVNGEINDLEAFRAAKRRQYRELPVDTVDHLVSMYGRAMDGVIGLAGREPDLARPLTDTQPVVAAEAAHAALHESAVTLGDFVFRRSGLGTLGDPGPEALERAAAAMGEVLGWAEARRTREIDAVRVEYA